ncbi:MAG: aldo/keto reductase, partial [Burkholderiales bacterium]
MDYRFLGRTGLRVSAVTLGAMTFGEGRPGAYSVQQLGVGTARELVATALDAGVNLVDTADAYGGGTSEEVLGAALGSRRGDVLIATKLHQRVGPGPNDIGSSRHNIIRACEGSLRRLGTDY